MIKKELGVYRRVPGSSDQKTDLFAFGEHPTLAAARNKHMPHIFSYLSLQQRLPILAIVFNTVISIIMVIPDSANFNSLGMVLLLA